MLNNHSQYLNGESDKTWMNGEFTLDHSIEKTNSLLETIQSNSHKQVDSRFEVTSHGVYFLNNGEQHWICSKLEVIALARDKSSENWGRLLSFEDADHQIHYWAMPMEMLKGGGEEMRGELLRLGLIIAPGMKNRNLLAEYIATANPEARACSVNRTGWQGNLFVLPQKTIGMTKDLVLFQTETAIKLYQQAGALLDWKENIACYCEGNTRLVLSISAAFASMLLYLVGAESGGIHLVGESSTGKTTALKVAASVFGSPHYLHRWRATTNGIEALAAMHSDTLLVLDELAQVESREAGEIAYMLANGSGKTRASKNGAARSRQEWRLLFLSAGEIGLAQHMQTCGKKARAGQEVRLVDLPADAGASLGIFEKLHGFASGAELSKHLTSESAKYFGSPALAFLEAITEPERLTSLPDEIRMLIAGFVKSTLPPGASGQVHRVCERFALIAMAGELATQLGITGWEVDEAKQAAIICFNAWIDQRGTVCNKERPTILSQVKAFFETHGESRFTNWYDDFSRTINRAGFKRREKESIRYYVLPESFRKDLCDGFDYQEAVRTLTDAGWLQLDSTGSPYRREYLPTLGRSRCYVFTNKMWED